jgi:hypothetical protein
MKLTYRRLFEVEIKHDYFLLPGPGEKLPLDYDISSTLLIYPTRATEQLMKDYKMVFKTTATGFAIFISAEQITPPSSYASLIDLDPGLMLSFNWSLQNSHFLNFTNQRLKEREKSIYYFSNRSASSDAGTIYLNKGILPFGTTYLGETLYHHGDIVRETGETYEMIEKESPVVNFPANASKWQKISTSVVNYVNPHDRLHCRLGIFRHERVNTSPGELIEFDLLYADATPIDLGLVFGTDRPQREYIAPASGGDRVNHSIDLQHVKSGIYTMKISELGGITNHVFYLKQPFETFDLFGVSEFYVSGAASAFQFVTEDPVTKRWMLDASSKKFVVRFRNRSTRWKYLNQDLTLFNSPPDPRPLTRTYSGYEIITPDGPLKLPDPSVDRIVPEIETELVKNIFSEIFLSK